MATRRVRISSDKNQSDFDRSDWLVAGLAIGFAVPVVMLAAILAFDHYTSDSEFDAAPATLVATTLSPTTTAPIPADTTVAPATTAAGIDAVALTASLGCTACHSIDGSPGVGPSWQGIAGTERAFEDGTSAIADDAYLIESIVDPSAKVVAGFPPVMPPSFGDLLSEAEVQALVEYIQTLG